MKQNAWPQPRRLTWSEPLCSQQEDHVPEHSLRNSESSPGWVRSWNLILKTRSLGDSDIVICTLPRKSSTMPSSPGCERVQLAEIHVCRIRPVQGLVTEGCEARGWLCSCLGEPWVHSSRDPSPKVHSLAAFSAAVWLCL